MKWMIIRHGETTGNVERRFSGTTDDPLSEEGVRKLIEMKNSGMYGDVEKALKDGVPLYVSPLSRCRKTAEILFPGQSFIIEADLREINFGIFEGKNHGDLKDLEQYRKWLESGGRMQIPGGDSKESFMLRIGEALKRIESRTLKEGRDTVVIVAHGGTIMAAREILTGVDFFERIPGNGEIFLADTGDSMKCS